jgi:CheY-like chemotaxis protein
VSRRAAILLVENDVDEVDVALRAFDRAGLDAPVDVARDGQEALEVLGLEPDLEAAPLRPRVVFLDLKMPRIDGWEVLRRVRESSDLRTLPIVVLSSSDREADVHRCYELGANSYVVKRFDTRSPGAYLAELARYWLELNRPPTTGGGA